MAMHILQENGSPFDILNDGYPCPGQVVQYYRKNTLINGKCWTQKDLAVYLNLTGKAVWLMENRNTGLDSFERRVKIASLFHIPPLLFKLSSTSPSQEQKYPGQVIKMYRKKKKKLLGKSWSQTDLAQALGLTEKSVSDMEQQHAGLDSLTRREALIHILNIPSVLLGLDLSQQVSFGNLPNQEYPAYFSAKAFQNEERLLHYKSFLPSYWDAYLTVNPPYLLKEVEKILSHLQSMAPYLHTSLQASTSELLCQYHQLASDIARDQGSHQSAISHATLALTLAQKMEHQELLTSSLYRQGFIYFDKGDFPLAAENLQYATSLAHDIDSQLKSMIFLEAGRFLSHASQDCVSILQTHHFLDQSECLVRQGLSEQDTSYVRLDMGRFHIGKAATLLQLRRFTDALDELDFADRLTKNEQLRRHAYINILRARVYLAQGELDFATELASSALTVCQALHSSSNIADIVQLHQLLKQSAYGHSPAVARLDMMLGMKDRRRRS